MATQTTIWQGTTPGGTEFEITIAQDGFALRCAALAGGSAGLLPCNINCEARTIQCYRVQFQLPAGAAEEILAAMDAATEPDLAGERRQLAARIGGLRDQIAHRTELAWERGDERGGVLPDPTLAAQLAEAEQALAAFDAAHPEVLAEIKQERAAAVERAMWN